LYKFTTTTIKLTVVIIVRYHCYQLYSKCYPVSFSSLGSYINEITEDHLCGFRSNSSTSDQMIAIVKVE
jgi:hypothetical protein